VRSVPWERRYFPVCVCTHLYAYVKWERVRRFRQRTVMLFCTQQAPARLSLKPSSVKCTYSFSAFHRVPSDPQLYLPQSSPMNPALPANHRDVWIGTRLLLQRIVNEYADGDDAAYIDKNDLRNGVATWIRAVSMNELGENIRQDFSIINSSRANIPKYFCKTDWYYKNS